MLSTNIVLHRVLCLSHLRNRVFCKTLKSLCHHSPPTTFLASSLPIKDFLPYEEISTSTKSSLCNSNSIMPSLLCSDTLSNNHPFPVCLRLAQVVFHPLQLVMQQPNLLHVAFIFLQTSVCRLSCFSDLSVPGCVRLSVEGILCSLKVFKSKGAPGIKNLRIGGLFGVTNEHFEELKFLLEVDNHKPLSACEPRFYQGGQLYLPFDDDRAIDIESCPRCQQLRQVYDCPAESCQGKHHATCRACTLCVARCVNCGCCIKGCDYEETFCLDLLCMGCLEAV